MFTDVGANGSTTVGNYTFNTSGSGPAGTAEPSTLVLLSAGLAAFAVFGRRKAAADVNA